MIEREEEKEKRKLRQEQTKKLFTMNEIICILQRNKVRVLGFIMGLKVSKGVSRYLVNIWDNIWFIVLFWCEIWGFAM